MNITIDDSSPRIQYLTVNKNSTKVWGRALESLDPGIVNYYKETFTLTTGEGDSMVFRFNGSAVYVYGSKAPNHGWFSVKIDERDPVLKIDTAPATRTYQALLHAEEDLDVSREHTITLTNLAGDARTQKLPDYYLDIDYIVIQAPVSSRIFTTVLDDSSSRINYAGSWSSNAHTDGSTVHVLSRPRDTGTLLFNGTAIDVVGTLYPDHGGYNVTIDGVPKGRYSGYARTPSLTNSARGAGNETGSGPYLDIDYIVIQTPFTSRIFTTIVPSAPPRLFYGGVWTSESNPDGSPVRTTRRLNDTASLTFYGSALEVLGTLSSDHGSFNVSIDGVVKGANYSGHAPSPVYAASLFSISGLEDTQHTMVITNLGGPNGNHVFDIQHVVVNTTIAPSPDGSANIYPSTSRATSRPTSSSTLGSYKYVDPGPTIAGATAGGGFLVLVVICVMSWLGWRKRRAAREQTRRAASGIDLVGGANRRESLGSDSSEYDPVPAEMPDPFPSSEWDRRPDRHTSGHPLASQSSNPTGAASGYLLPHSGTSRHSESVPRNLQTGATLGPSRRTDLKSAILAFLAADPQPGRRAEAGPARSQWPVAMAGIQSGRDGNGDRLDRHRRDEDGSDVMPPSYDLAVGRI